MVGGVGDYTLRLAEALVERGAEALVLARDDPRVERSARVPVRASVSRWGLLGAGQVARETKALQPDVVLFQYVPYLYSRWGLPLGLLATLGALRRSGIPVVLVAHEPFNYGALTSKHRLVAACQRRLFGALARRCAAVVVTSRARGRSVEPIVGPGCRVRVIPVGATLPGAETAPRAQAARPEPPFRVATFGRLELGRRRLDVLHDAAARVASGEAPVVLELVGPTDAAADRWREGLAPRAGLEVACHGTVTAEEAARTLALSHAAVLFDTSALGGISTRSTVAANLLAAGVPVISNAGADTGEPFLDGANVLLCPPEPATLAQRLALLRDDTALRERLARGGRLLFERELAWPVIAGRYLAVLDELQAGERAQSAMVTLAGQ